VTPPVDNNGPIVIPVTVNDGQGGTFEGTITIEPVNPPPVANDDSEPAEPETPLVVDLTGNDTDPDGDPFEVVSAELADPTQGTLVRNPDGSYTFTSAPGVSGPVVINYTIRDQDGAEDSATHTVNVANQPPVLEDPNPGDPESPEVDPTDPTNLIVPAVDGTQVTVDLDDYFSDPNPGDVLTITPDLSSL
ncbi:Ig-like domain-containing protein, partial [Hydrogenophaga sp. NFH-34]|uniref:Ig-like domain-containing protein n=1 Tax=Hydrogenophaga sp. NFH-34 TaxID=2744446 RepID=UPI001F23E6F6